MFKIPEITGLDSRVGFVRIPSELDVPLTGRVRRLLDTESFRRLSRISQVGFVSLVYPAACHTRFEHSLGVYRLSLLFIRRLEHLSGFSEIITQHDAELLIVSALLHDIGHWSFCHLVEDISLDGVQSHELLSGRYLFRDEVALILRRDWGIEPEEVFCLLNKNELTGVSKLPLLPVQMPNQKPAPNIPRNFLSSILSGPIDIDKMDYLYRDSLHAGVPYGRNLDQERLIGSLCVNALGDGLAITEKGKTAAELMIFARYVMFSEVYWHHAVRAASAMFQRLFCELLFAGQIKADDLYDVTESEFIRIVRNSSSGTDAELLSDGLFGSRRVLYKRVAQFGIMEQPEIYRKLAGKPYSYLCEIANRIEECVWGAGRSKRLQVLIDAPPVEREIEIEIDVFFNKEKKYKPLEEISPVVRAMAKEQFDDYAKRVRIFAHPEAAQVLRKDETIIKILNQEV
ncbi:MAG: HD domain-containing protein [Planctomycetaceae bacterium]|jgi:HD superfamily phosphohydrolase|nr:HD domain-containing protein [Planctomycetaceae bacterium]